MQIADKVIRYFVSVDQNNYQGWFRQIMLNLESGDTAYIGFPKERPEDWLQFFGSATDLFMTQDEFTDVYHILQSENPVYFTALAIAEIGMQIGMVHTNNYLDEGGAEIEAGAGQKVREMIRRARKQREQAPGPRPD